MGETRFPRQLAYIVNIAQVYYCRDSSRGKLLRSCFFRTVLANKKMDVIVFEPKETNNNRASSVYLRKTQRVPWGTLPSISFSKRKRKIRLHGLNSPIPRQNRPRSHLPDNKIQQGHSTVSSRRRIPPQKRHTLRKLDEHRQNTQTNNQTKLRTSPFHPGPRPATRNEKGQRRSRSSGNSKALTRPHTIRKQRHGNQRLDSGRNWKNQTLPLERTGKLHRHRRYHTD